MFVVRNRFHLGNVFGIPVYLDLSTAILLLFFLGMTGNLVLDVVCAAALLVSIVLHELGHSLTARCFGCETRDITLSFIGGCASLERMPRKAVQEFLTAAAGPAVSFALAFALWFGYVFVPADLLATALFYVAVLNFTLGSFNLLPGFPMDGGRMFRSVMRLFVSRTQATRIAMIVGRVAAVLLVLGPFLGIHHVWIIPVGGNFFLRLFIAWMIWKEGYREYRLALEEERWYGNWNFDCSARVSRPPYEDGSDEVDVKRK